MDSDRLNSSNKELIRCTKVSKSFGYFYAIKNISFSIKQNSIFGLLGANGAGKTTLIKILSGLLKPNEGEIIIAGMSFDKMPIEIRKTLGIMIDQSFLFEDLTIYENLKFYSNIFGHFNVKKINNQIEKFTKLFNLADWKDEHVRNLSTGMKRKVELIRALIHEPQILLIDELFSGLDFGAIDTILNLIRQLNGEENVTIFFSTHHIDLAVKICDEILVLKRGKINKLFKKGEIDQVEIKSFY